MPKQLDRSRPFATVCGQDPSIFHRYEQDGCLFDHEGHEMDPDTGKTVPFDVMADAPDEAEPDLERQQPEEKPEPVLSWKQREQPQGTKDAPRLVTIEIDGEPLTVDMDENSYTKREEMMEVLDKLGARYYRRDSRHVLFKKLISAAEKADKEQNG